MAEELLVVGYGNTLRSDDGIGPRVAETIEALQLPGVRTLARPQLTPELADSVSKAAAVIFVDACVEIPARVQMRRLEPADTPQLQAHSTDPRALLALARDAFGRAPEAWWLTVPAEKLSFGDELSTVGRRGLKTAVRKLKDFHRLWMAVSGERA